MSDELSFKKEAMTKKITKFAALVPVTNIWTVVLRHGLVLKVEDGDVREEKCFICMRTLIESRKTVVHLKNCLHQCHQTCIKKVFKKNSKYQIVCPNPDCWNILDTPLYNPGKGGWKRGVLYVKFDEDEVKIQFELSNDTSCVFKLKKDEEIVTTVSLLLKAWKLRLLTDQDLLNSFKNNGDDFIKNYLNGLNMIQTPLLDEYVHDIDYHGDKVDGFRKQCNRNYLVDANVQLEIPF